MNMSNIDKYHKLLQERSEINVQLDKLKTLILNEIDLMPVTAQIATYTQIQSQLSINLHYEHKNMMSTLQLRRMLHDKFGSIYKNVRVTKVEDKYGDCLSYETDIRCDDTNIQIEYNGNIYDDGGIYGVMINGVELMKRGRGLPCGESFDLTVFPDADLIKFLFDTYNDYM